MAVQQSGFSGYTASAHCKPDYNFAHNLRVADSIYNQEHIGPGEYENWIGGDEIEPRTLFNDVFEESIKKYNENQKRSDRKIRDYYQRVIDDGRFGKTKILKIGNKTKTIDISRKPIYEFVIQIGNREKHPDSQESKKAMKSFIENVWKEKFGKNFKLVRVDYHDDEYSLDQNNEHTIKSPAHIHVDFIPVVEKKAEELKGKGVLKLELQHSLSQACEQAGFKTDHLTEEERNIKKELKEKIRKAKEDGNKELKEQLQEQLIAYSTFTSQQRFEEAVRFAFAEHCKNNGIEIDLTPGKKHGHQNKQLYQLNQEKKHLKETIEKKEQLENIVNEKIAELKKDKEIFEQKKAEDLADIETKQNKLDYDKNEFEKQKKNDLAAIKEDKDNFEETRKNAEEILAREETVKQREADADKREKEQSEWIEKQRTAQDYLKSHNIDSNYFVLNAEIPELLEPEDKIFHSESREDYTKRNLRNFKNIIEEKITHFKKKFNSLVNCVKSLLEENKKLKKENKNLRDGFEAELKKEVAKETERLEAQNKETEESYKKKLNIYENFMNGQKTTFIIDGQDYTCLTGLNSIKKTFDELHNLESITPAGLKNLAKICEARGFETVGDAEEYRKSKKLSSLFDISDKPQQ